MRIIGTLIIGLFAGVLLGCHGSAAPEAQPSAAVEAPSGAAILASTKAKKAASVRGAKPRKAERNSRRAALNGARGTYSGEPRTADGRIDIDRLARELEVIGANTYNFLIKVGENDWDDLQEFLPVARERGINVWVTVTCPSKKSKMSHPFGHDYIRWAEEIAELSIQEPNLVAWGMDDFSYNRAFFTRGRLEQVLQRARRINPNLAFVPTIYYKHAVREKYPKQYKGLFDGVLFPYRAESGGRGNLEDPSRAASEIADMRSLFDGVPIILDVYASRHSAMGESTPEYVQEVMQAGREHADGLMVFRHQQPGTAKWAVVSASFAE